MEEKEARTDLLPPQGLGVGVEAEEHAAVPERVLLLRPGALLHLLAGGAEDGLDLGGVDEAGHVGVVDLGGRQAKRGNMSGHHNTK